jgi:TIR domain/Tetratricopeptide repeat
VFDVFLCYNWDDDKPWADGLHAELDRRDVRVFQDDKNIPYGDTLDPALRDALLGSRMLVPLIGPSFHESPSCRRELLLALTAAYRLEGGSTERVMPVIWRVRPSELRPAELKKGMLLRREEHDVAAQAEIIATRVGKLRAKDNRRFGDAPSSPEPEWYPRPLPANRRFHGRGEVMWELHDSLQVKAKPGNRGHPVVSVTGLGGQGKSALCEQYARQFAEDHPGGVFLIRLGGSDRRAHPDVRGMFSQFHLHLRMIAERLGLPVGADRDVTSAAVTGELASRPPYLWIVDDVPSTVDERQLELLFAPTENGRTLLSTRGRLGPCVSVEIELGPLERRDCVRVLTIERPLPAGRTPERDAAAGIADDLGRLPLGLTIAAGLTTLPTFTDYRSLRQSLRVTSPDALELANRMADELPVGYAKPLSTTLTRSFAGLTDAGQDALAVASVLGPAPIPRDLVDGVLKRPEGSSAVAGLQRIVAHGLAHDLGDDSYLVHALVARAARFHFPPAHLQRLHGLASNLIGDELEAGRGDFDRTRSTQPYLAHVLPLATTTEWPVGAAQWHMLNEAGRSQYELGDTASALHAMTVLHEMCERSPDVDEETRLAVLVNLGATHYGQRNLAEALRIQREVVARFESLEGPAHPDTLQAKENLANTLSELGEIRSARSILTEVYRLRRDTAGRIDRATLTTLNNLVIAVGRTGARRLALRLALGAWALWHRAAGPDAPQTLESVENIGNNLLHLGYPQEAAMTHAYVARRRRIVLGPDHPDTIDATENVATARRLSYGPVYAERLRVQGPVHPDTLETLGRLLRAGLRAGTPRPGGLAATRIEDPDWEPVGEIRLDGEHAGELAELVALAVEFEQHEAAHGPDDPRALRAKILLAHALGAADQLDGQIDVALAIVTDSRDGLEEAAARRPHTVEPYDLPNAEAIHHWILGLTGQDPSY